MRIRQWAFFALCCMAASCAHDPYSVSVIDATSANYGKNKSLYSVRKGDTLYSIAFRYGTTVTEIARLNNISEPYLIHPGQKLLVLGHVQTVANQTHTKIIPKPSRTVAPVTPKAVVKPKLPAVNSTPTAKKAPVVVKPKEPKPKPSVPPSVKPVPPKTKAPVAAPKVVKPKPVAPAVASKHEQWLSPSKGRLGQGFKLGKQPHKGQNYHGVLGSPVVASRSGTVVYAGDGLKSYGLLVIIKHDERYLSAYAYNRNIKVKEGQYVKQGETVAEMGKKADTVTLHFEIRRDGKPINPMSLLK